MPAFPPENLKLTKLTTLIERVAAVQERARKADIALDGKIDEGR